MGEVNRGDTVTDFLPEERNRGISISSASVCFRWQDHIVNLIDTPGHVDFSSEVERALAVMDGAVVILDSCKGVQAQTRTVWRQADRFNLPRIVFINKMDRNNASYVKSIESLKKFLAQKTYELLLLHYPVFQNQKFIGNINLANLTLQIWNPLIKGESITASSRSSSIHDLFSLTNKHLEESKSILQKYHLKLDQILDARNKLINSLAISDNYFGETEFLSIKSPELTCSPETLISAIRRATLSHRAIPVLLGSAFTDVSITPLMDSIVDFLPNPHERPLPSFVQDALTSLSHEDPSNSPTLMFIYKIISGLHRGSLSLARIYSGSLNKNDHDVINFSQKVDKSRFLNDKIQRILKLTGDSFEELSSCQAGDIVALAGLQTTRCGDLLIKQHHVKIKDQDQESITDWQIRPPVVYASILPNSRSDLKPLEIGLKNLKREDPSFTADFNAETGQWVIGGQGDLHLDIMLSRLKREYKLLADIGPLQISYRESPIIEDIKTFKSSNLIDPKKTIYLQVVLSLSNKKSGASAACKNNVHLDKNLIQDTQTGDSGWKTRFIKSLHDGILIALDRSGRLIHSPVCNLQINLSQILLADDEDAFAKLSNRDLIASSSLLVHNRLRKDLALQTLIKQYVVDSVHKAIDSLDAWQIMEPIMAMEILIPRDSVVSSTKGNIVLNKFLSELTNRKANIISVDSASDSTSDHLNEHQIIAEAPLSVLEGFSSAIRTLSHGIAELHIQVSDYRPVSLEAVENGNHPDKELLRRLKMSNLI